MLHVRQSGNNAVSNITFSFILIDLPKKTPDQAVNLDSTVILCKSARYIAT